MVDGADMQFTHLGRSGLRVSRLCLGTMNFAWKTSEPDSFAIMDRSHDYGVNFFDTANVYGNARGEGLTEKILGRWFAQGGGRRERTVLATKVYGTMGDWPNDEKLSALNIRRACDASLIAAPDGLHRPVPDAPRRPGHALGRDLGGNGGAALPGQNPLCRFVQFRRMAHCQGTRSGGTTQLHGARL